MKTKLLITGLTVLALSTLNSQLSTAFAQGSLTPPGLPAPTMKSADQIYSKLDPRTPISSAPFIITNSGSYYLTCNLTVSSGDAIDINTNGVTLDLNGFIISSTTAIVGGAATGYAILLGSGLQDITIVNGHICSSVVVVGTRTSGNGFASGIDYVGSQPTNVIVGKVTVSGVGNNGINLGLGNSTLVEDCTATGIGGMGISASTVKSSIVTCCQANSGSGSIITGDLVVDCQATLPGRYANGILATTAVNCYGQGGIIGSPGVGVTATVAIGCVGTGLCGIRATNATSCWIQYGTTNICYKWNMP